MNWTIEFAPFMGWPFYWALVLLASLVMLAVLWGGGRGRVLRVIALAALVFALANPVLRKEQRRPLPNVVLVVVDQSDSQKLTGRLPLTEQVRSELARKFAAIPNLQVRWITAAKPAPESGEGTALFAAVNRGLSHIPADRLAAVVMVTDGQVHDVPAKVHSLGIKAPLHGIITGRKGETDRRIEVLKAPRYGLVGSVGKARLRVSSSGGAQGGKARDLRPAKINIIREGRKLETRIVEVDQSFEIDIPFPHAGTNIVEVELAPVADELTEANNRAVIVAEGVRENLRVLLVSGEPHPGERTWRNLLKSDAAVDLVHFTILRPPRKQDGTPIHQLSLIAFPTRELFSEKLEDFDLIIFDRYKRRGVLPLFYFDNIAEYVRKGGAILVAAGEAFAGPRSLAQTPLAQILPASPTGRMTEVPYRARTTKEGWRHPVTRSLPGAGDERTGPQWGRWLRIIDAEYHSGRRLLRGPDDKPLLILDRVGKGRVAMLLSDHAWLWARRYDGGGPFNDLFRRLSHWLMKEPDLEEEALTAKGQGDKLVIERRSMSDRVADVEVTGPTGQTSKVKLKKVSPGLWRAAVEAPIAGIYRVKSGAREAAAHVGKLSPKEVAAMTATDQHLRPIVEATGGGIFWAASAASKVKTVRDKDKAARAEAETTAKLPRIALLPGGQRMSGEGWLGLADRKAYVVQGVKLTPLVSGLIALAVALMLLAGTWYREGH